MPWASLAAPFRHVHYWLIAPACCQYSTPSAILSSTQQTSPLADCDLLSGRWIGQVFCLFVSMTNTWKKNHLKGERTDLISMSEFLSTLGWPHCFLPYFSGKLCKQVCSPRDCQEAKRQEGAGARCFFLGHTPGDLLPPKKCHRYKSTPCMVNPLLSSVPSWSNHFQQWQHMTPLQGWGGHLKSDPRGHGLVFNE